MGIEVGMVAASLVFFIAALDRFRRTYMLAGSPKHAGRWLALGLMVAGFLVGYAFFLGHLINVEKVTGIESLVAAIFLGGSVFVFVCSVVFHSTTGSLTEVLHENQGQSEELARQARVLGETVDRRSFELAEERAQLAEARIRSSELQKESRDAHMVAHQRLEGIRVMAAGIAHDFNNLLVGILGNASYAKQLGMQEGSDLEDALTDVEEAAERAAGLTAQLTAYCSKVPPNLETVNLSFLVKEILSLMRPSIDARVKVVPELQEDLSLIWGDSTRFRQLVMNLVTNACEAVLPGTGNVVVGTGVLEMATSDIEGEWTSRYLLPGPYVYLRVRDEGCGILASDQPQVFEPFFSTKGLGRGLGLAAAEGIAQNHGGDIRLSSVEGKWTEVTAVFPVIGDVEDSDAEKRPDLASGQRSGRILVVDDEPIVLDTIRRGLRQSGYEVDTARARGEFLDLLNGVPHDYVVAIVDIMMPDLLFEEVVKALRDRFPRIPILVSSGYSNIDITESIKDMKQIAVLAKPYRLASLLAAVDQVSGNSN